MGQTIELTAADGFKLSAYRADPAKAPRGGIVVAQEIFGVNSHIRSVCDGYAADGYVVIAPALFDRYERGVDIGYTPDGHREGARAQGARRRSTRRCATSRPRATRSRSAGKVARDRLLLGRIRRVDDGVASAGIRVRGPVLRRRHPRGGERAAAVPGDGAFRRARHDDPRGRRARARRRPIPTRRSTRMPRITASTAISGARTTPPRRSSRASARCNSCSATWADALWADPAALGRRRRARAGAGPGRGVGAGSVAVRDRHSVVVHRVVPRFSRGHSRRGARASPADGLFRPGRLPVLPGADGDEFFAARASWRRPAAISSPSRSTSGATGRRRGSTAAR